MDKLNENSEIPFRTKILGYVCQDGEIGRRARLKLSWTEKSVRVRFPFLVQNILIRE